MCVWMHVWVCVKLVCVSVNDHRTGQARELTLKAQQNSNATKLKHLKNAANKVSGLGLGKSI